jgi:hypothetical protein
MVTKSKNLTQNGTEFSKYLLIYSAIKLNVLAPELGSKMLPLILAMTKTETLR